MLRARHVSLERVAVVPRGQECVRGIAGLGLEQLEVSKAGEAINEVRSIAKLILEFSLVFRTNRQVRDEDEHDPRSVTSEETRSQVVAGVPKLTYFAPSEIVALASRLSPESASGASCSDLASGS